MNDDDVLLVDNDEKVKNVKIDVEQPHDEDTEEERDMDYDRKQSRHRRSRSREHILESVKKELQDMREMIQRIPGVSKPFEKASPTSFSDSPFSDDITMLETLK
ncbi:hypothetical protein AgCh_029199 [Apium graveolens]